MINVTDRFFDRLVAQRSHVGSIELTADPDAAARPAGRSAPQPLSMDADDGQHSDMLAQSILQQQVATALRIKQKLGKGLRSGGAQLLSAQEPTDDFADQPTDPIRVPPAWLPTNDRTEKAKANDPSGSQLTELMSVSQLKAEVHNMD